MRPVAVRSLFENGRDRSAFVAARAQLEAGFEFKQTEAVHSGPAARRARECRFSMILARAGETPRQCMTIALGFSSISRRLRLTRAAAVRATASSLARTSGESGSSSRRPSGCRRSAPCRPQTSGAGSTPQQREDFRRGAASDDDHARSALVLDLIQEVAHAGPGLRLEAIDAEWRQRAVIVQQQ